MKLYHVFAGEYQGQDLESLAYRLGFDEAIEKFCEKWGHDDSSLADYHVYKIFMYDDLEKAIEHQEEFGGTILEIDTQELEVEYDNLEAGTNYPTVKNIIPAGYIKVI